MLPDPPKMCHYKNVTFLTDIQKFLDPTLSTLHEPRSSWPLLGFTRPPLTEKSGYTSGISLYENLFTDSRYDITSVNFNSENVHEDDIFVLQDILQFFSGESKDYKYLKSP